jgi:hypothetical protein
VGGILGIAEGGKKLRDWEIPLFQVQKSMPEGGRAFFFYNNSYKRITCAHEAQSIAEGGRKLWDWEIPHDKGL